MNRHMNLFRFYGESESKEKLENNLTKGLALCLKYDPSLLHSFIAEIDPLYSSITIPPQDSSFFDIGIQVPSNGLEGERVIAVSMTVDDYTSAQYDAVKKRLTKSPIIDLVITYADTVIICEIKPTNENCLAQLKNQVFSYKKNAKETFISFSWKKVAALIEKVTNVNKSMGQPSHISSDYLDMLKGHFPMWHQISRLNELTIRTKNLQYNIEQRLIEVCSSLNEMELTDFKRRISFQLKWAMATELKIQTSEINGAICLEDIFIEFCFWAGDTKKQGHALFKGDYAQQLLFKKNMTIRNEAFSINSEPYIRVSSWQKGIAWFDNIKKEDYSLFNKSLFDKLAGRWRVKDWAKVDKLVSKFDLDWKEQSKWDDEVENSNRTQVDISMGVRTKLYVPFSTLRKAESKNNGLNIKLREILQAMNTEFGSIGG
jgi:hypothetical protein